MTGQPPLVGKIHQANKLMMIIDITPDFFLPYENICYLGLCLHVKKEPISTLIFTQINILLCNTVAVVLW